ncbi:LysE family translocator [Saccharospirillum mangrovi]|uniref:LysE family translocator n=1 Tax=Saccharospirillum mangrovi TaxID=2161747 RepID=UPI000D3CEF32|nr:LysE family translocator [Saccharospirillum mangrovi]
MLGINDLWLFVISGIVLNILPGPDSLYIVSRSASQGFKAGSAASLGIGSGTFVHIFAAALGLSAVLATSATAFTVVKIVGALYLISIAVPMIFSRVRQTQTVQTVAPTRLSKIYRQGFLTNALNPKVALFFLAFVPQFIDPASDNKALAFIVLGLIFNLNGMIWAHLLAWTSAHASRRVKQNPILTLWLTRLAGGLFGYFGVKLAFSAQ